MSPAKKYQPHCPASDCPGGHDRLHEFPRILIPEEILDQLRSTYDKIYRCNYCGLVWSQSSTRLPGFDPLPLGHYDSLGHSGFVPTTQVEIRKSNKAK
jgi:hypothetical protein